ncbi:MAG TPA: ergothioneine biosynthesis protein EgtB, partial [Anaeromyxobacteraceae bacterium]|nr:ergothioneine biosynthesis protein EgtB [Anaeromyxobacteraceae bacterium]
MDTPAERLRPEKADPRERGAALARRFAEVRAATDALAAPLSPEDALVQSMPDASPAKWHLAHTTWFFETFVLARLDPERAPFHPAYGYLFNSYYDAVGPRHPRPQRGLLSRPPLEEVRRYRARIDEEVGEALLSGRAAPVLDALELGLAHEEQHQELLLTDVKHGLWSNPLRPAYASLPERGPWAPRLEWLERPGGVGEVGAGAAGFAFDNERPRHRTWLGPHRLASRPVTAGEWLAFVHADGYRRPELWLADGWAAVQRNGWTAPLYWERDGSRWAQFTLGGMREVDETEAVAHVSFFEADAFARWADARLPTEAEWETAAADAPADGTFAEDRRFHPGTAHAGL